MAEREIGKIYTTYEVKGLGKVESQIKSTEQQTGKLEKSLKSLGGAIAGAFAVDRLISFGKELIEIAAKTEGVRTAFNSLNDKSLLNNLREATRGTVNDLTLMTNAVKANNFRIPLEALPKLFEFAAKRARQTGDDVNYLVDSIITGIGRKSPLILDNLGISAVELRSKLNGVGVEMASVGDVARVVGGIASSELLLMGSTALTTADKIDQLNAMWERFKTGLGGALIDLIVRLSDGFDFFADSTRRAMDAVVNSMQIARASLIGFSKDVAQDAIRGKTIPEIERLIDTTQAMIVKIKDFKKPTAEQEKAILGLTIKLNAYRQRLGELLEIQEKDKKEIKDKKNAIEELTEALKEQNKIITSTADAQTKAIAQTKYNQIRDELAKVNEQEYKRNENLKATLSYLEAISKYGTGEDGRGKIMAEFSDDLKNKGIVGTNTSPIRGRGGEPTAVAEKIKPAVNLVADMGDLIGSELINSLSSLGDTLSSTFARAIVGAESFNQSLRNILGSLAEIALKSVFGTLIGSIGGGGLLGGLFKSTQSSPVNIGGIASGGVTSRLNNIENSIKAQTLNQIQTSSNIRPVVLNIDGKTIATTLANVDNKLGRNGVKLNEY